MSLKGVGEFYLFMDMRAEFQWASFNMTPQKWVIATQEYNTRLEALNSARQCRSVTKNPRALMEMLGDIEVKIADRIARKDFVCKCPSPFIHSYAHSLLPSFTAVSSKTETFWTRHCNAVPLNKTSVNTTVNSSGKPVSHHAFSQLRVAT
jgi:hypothetical protein